MILKKLCRNISNHNLVCIDYNTLNSNLDLSKEISDAFGESGLGILTVKNIPGYAEKRKRLLPLGRSIALLPDHLKKELERPQDKYQVGWSHGIEKFEGKPDYSKGSFYSNPEVDNPPTEGEWPSNIWPHKTIPDLEPALKSLAKEIIRVGSLLAKHLDNFISSKIADYEENTLETIISTHKAHISRLLHYFPTKISDQKWCGWHNDHCILTGLTSSIYLDQETGRVVSSSEISNEKAGLYIKSRNKEVVKVKPDADNLCFQIGETAQILSGGFLQATPHAVLSAGDLGNVCRNTFAVFMEPRGHFILKTSRPDHVFFEHDDVPSLKKRWKQGITFGEFHRNTINLFN
jgi:isopenicillin N synthase-like dioxygenase